MEESLRALFSGSVRADALGEWELENPAGSLSLFRLQTAANSRLHEGLSSPRNSDGEQNL
ncbi:MAG: hypothetical protein ACLT98_03685 [Eggerthellaceae bacterium]